MLLSQINPLYADHIDYLAQKAAQPSLWQAVAEACAREARQDFGSADEALDMLHRMQRLRQVFVAGLENDAAFHAAFVKEQAALPLWHDFTSPPVAGALQERLATQLYNAKAGKDVAFLLLGNGARRVSALLLEKCMADGLLTSINIADDNFGALLLRHTDAKAIESLAEDFLSITQPVTKRMVALGGMQNGPVIKLDHEKDQLYTKLTHPFHDRVLSGEIFYTLTRIPTPKDAQIEQIDYADFIKLFFEMCDQPWHYIDIAQQALIAELNAAKTLRFTNDDGTDISMDITDATFANSLVAKNVPGSEVFSAPRRDSVNGKIVAKGRFNPRDDRNAVIENLTMEFEQGRLVRWHADQGQEHFERAISIDEGAKFVGEIGIGTNPHLRRHVMNSLLVEKIGGSFHVALGGAYKYKEYMGTPVNVDNGNRSKLHWDITTLLYGKGGCMYIDDRKVMENGLFLNPTYDVFNRGWAAVPEAERPDYWKNHPSVIAATAAAAAA